MKRTAAFLMTLLYLSFVAGQVWNCCEESNVAFSSFSQVSIPGDYYTPEPDSCNRLSKERCSKTSSEHPSATKIKISRFSSEAVSLKGFVVAGLTYKYNTPVSTVNSLSYPTPLFLRNRVLRI